jgi:transcriptional regulator with XRE-family HTH domain
MTELNFSVIGKKIKQRRLSLQITQEQLADYLDVNPSHISNIECGRTHPSLTALVAIASFLNCSVDTFIDTQYHFQEFAVSSNETDLDKELQNKLQQCSRETKEKLSKIMDIL